MLYHENALTKLRFTDNLNTIKILDPFVFSQSTKIKMSAEFLKVNMDAVYSLLPIYIS